MLQIDAVALHGITLDMALKICKHSLILIGTTLESILNQVNIRAIKEKLNESEFKELALVMRDPRASDVSQDIKRRLINFVNSEDIEELVKSNLNNKLSLYICIDFIRYSATYIDHQYDFGKIMITHSIYGSLMQEAPSYFLTLKKIPKLYANFVRAWESLKKRSGVDKVSNIMDLYNFRKKISTNIFTN